MMIILIINTLCVCIFLLLSLRDKRAWVSEKQASNSRRLPVCVYWRFFHNTVAQKCFSYQILSPLHQFQSPCTLSSTSLSIIRFSAGPKKHWRMKTPWLTLGVLNNTLNKRPCGDSLPCRCVRGGGHAAHQTDGKMKGWRSLEPTGLFQRRQGLYDPWKDIPLSSFFPFLH